MGRHWILTSPALPRGHFVLGRDAIIIGREPGCPVRLFSMEVSRRHARIARAAVGYTIQDLGSANGTFVNGRGAAQPVTLDNDDLITIGSVQIQFRIVDGERPEISNRFSPGLEETAHVVKEIGATAAQFAGKFTRETLHQVVQLVEFHGHSGVLRVEAGGVAGFLRYKSGVVVDARFGPTRGEKAARTLLSSLGGEYAFYAVREGAEAAGGPLSLQGRGLILEILQQDESKKTESSEFLDVRPGSGEHDALPEPPVAGDRTQRIDRADLPKDLPRP